MKIEVENEKEHNSKTSHYYICNQMKKKQKEKGSLTRGNSKFMILSEQTSYGMRNNQDAKDQEDDL